LGSVPQNYGENLTLIGALSLRGLQAPMTVDGATDGEVFRAYVEQVLCPTLESSDVVVMDNLAAHKANGAQVIYLSPYSPDWNLIEKCWSKLKIVLRAMGARSRETLEAAIAQVIKTVSQADALGWFAHF
jgi:transposase